MTSRERILLIISLVLSLLYWSWTYGTYVGSMLVLCILIHEYGHYYWMKREGILKRSMVMMPPLGAVAFAKEPWPSRGAESRIALAGPAFGLLSILFPLAVWLVYGDYESRISIFFACFLNLFNLLLPIAILDGGRVIKSILFSINKNLGFGFYYYSFGVLFVFTLIFLSTLTLIFSILLYMGLSNELNAARTNPIYIGLKSMTRREMVMSALSYLAIVGFFLLVMILNNVYFPDLIKYLSLTRP